MFSNYQWDNFFFNLVWTWPVALKVQKVKHSCIRSHCFCSITDTHRILVSFNESASLVSHVKNSGNGFSFTYTWFCIRVSNNNINCRLFLVKLNVLFSNNMSILFKRGCSIFFFNLHACSYVYCSLAVSLFSSVFVSYLP